MLQDGEDVETEEGKTIRRVKGDKNILVISSQIGLDGEQSLENSSFCVVVN